MNALVVDDHPLIREAVSNVLRRLDPSAEIASAGDCECALELAACEPEPDVVLLDLSLPGVSGIAAVKLWRTQFPGLPLIVLSATADQRTVLAAMGAGAAGFIPKSSSNEVMLSAVRLVLAGGKYFPADVLVRHDGVPGTPKRRRDVTVSTVALGFTARQLEVLRLIASGASNKMICRELGLAERTVKTHVTAILRALKVSSRTQAAIEASKLGLGAPPRPSGRGQEH